MRLDGWTPSDSDGYKTHLLAASKGATNQSQGSSNPFAFRSSEDGSTFSQSSNDLFDSADREGGLSSPGPGGDKAQAPSGPKRRMGVSAECFDPSELADTERIFFPKTEEARKRIEASVADNFLFRNLEGDQRDEIVDAMFEKAVPAGVDVIVQGDKGDFFYVVDKGAFDILVNGEKKVTIGPGGGFGELALMYNEPRAATVRANVDSVVWAVDRKTFRKTVLRYNDRKRKLYEERLKKVDLFKTLDPSEISKVIDCLEPVEFKPGDLVIRQGDPGETFFLIMDGEALVSISDHGQNECDIGRLKTGEYFGERALITHEPRAATVKAVTPLKCVSLDSKAFTRLLGPLMEIMKRNMAQYRKYEEIIRKSPSP